MNYGREGEDFFTCGQYNLCKECTNLYKPCLEHSEDMLREHLKKQKDNKQLQDKEIEMYYDDLSKEIDYWNGFE